MFKVKVRFLIQRKLLDGSWIYLEHGGPGVIPTEFSSLKSAEAEVHRYRQVYHYRLEIPFRIIKRTTKTEVAKQVAAKCPKKKKKK